MWQFALFALTVALVLVGGAAQALVHTEAVLFTQTWSKEPWYSLNLHLALQNAQVQNSVAGANAVSKEVVFPLFNQLGALHMAITEELRLLVVRQRLYDGLEAARNQVGACVCSHFFSISLSLLVIFMSWLWEGP